MTTNRDWLFSLPLEEQYAWMNAEHQDGTLDGDTAALNAKIAELERKLRISWEYECKFQDERDELQEQVDAKDNCIENIMQTLHETQARASNLADDLLTANRQREQYRKLFGMALDWAHEITMLETSIDEGMA